MPGEPQSDQALLIQVTKETHNAVLAWFGRNGRSLPWRSSRDPWTIAVAELMLQQTQVARVLERWPDFIAQFHSAAATAAQPQSSVVAQWNGLGYNRRAVALHQLAVAIVERYDGVVPRSTEELQSLPGIGPYTSAAIRVFAYEDVDAVVDTNVGRIIARVHGRGFKPAECRRIAFSWVPVEAPWQWNQALLDVGATVCRAKSWQCDRCPFESVCQWKGDGVDPAVGSAAVSKPQSTFAGSDRQGRGRLVTRLSHGDVDTAQLGSIMGWENEPERVERVLASLVADGLVVVAGDKIQLA